MIQETFEICNRCLKEKTCVSFLGSPNDAGERPEWNVCPKCIEVFILEEQRQG